MLRFSANLGFLWPELPLLEKIAAAGRAGFRAAEMHWPYDVPTRELRAACADRSIRILGVNTVRGDIDKGENGLGALAGREAEFQAAVDQSIRFCVEAGGTAIHCMAGRVGPEERREARKTFVANLREASDKAAPHGLTLLLEPLNAKDAPDYFYSTLEEGAIVIEEADRPNIKLMFDAYHVGLTEGDVIGKLETYWPIVGHVQIAAVPTRSEPDEGSFDFRPFFKALERLEYQGWVGAEYKPRGATDAGLGWISALGVKL